MGSRTSRYKPGLPGTRAATATYRAEICRNDTPGSKSKYYDGGDFSPYCMESLVELLRSEAQSPYLSMGLTLEIRGRCTLATLRDLTRRFSEIDAPNIRINIRATGFPTITLNSPRGVLEPDSALPRSAAGRKRS